MTARWPRWALIVAVLAVAGYAALWPRDGTGPVATPRGTPVAPDIDELRARAALQPCPAPAPGVTSAGALAGVVVPCLGHEGEVDLGAALAGRPALLNAWGPLCKPCQEEMPALAAYAAEPGAVPVLGVEVQGLSAGGLDLMATLGVHYPSVSDPRGELRAALRFPPVLPVTYIVSPDGSVQQVNPPEVFRDPAQVRVAVARYLGDGS